MNTPEIKHDHYRLPHVIRVFTNSQFHVRLSPSARKEYARHIERIKKFFGEWVDIRDLTTEEINAFFTELDKGGPTLRRTAGVVIRHLFEAMDDAGFKVKAPKVKPGKVLSFAQREKIVHDRALANGTSVQEEKKGWASWTEEDFWKFTSLCKSVNIRMFAFLTRYTGQRASDVIKIKWEDIDEATGYISIQQVKTGKLLQIPIHPVLQKELTAYRCEVRHSGTFKRQGQVLVSIRKTGQRRQDGTVVKHGQPLTLGSISAAVKRSTKELLGKKLGPHGLRKLMVISLAERGATEREIMSVTGHTSPKSVETYVADARQKLLADNAMKKLLS